MPRHAALSPSRAKDFTQCPLKFRFRVIDSLPEPPSLEALRGTLVHSVLEHLFDLPAPQRTEEAAQELLLPRWKEHIQHRPHDAELFADDAAFEEWYSSARPLIAHYFRLENPQHLEPFAREQFVNATLPSGLHIRGIIDRIDRSPAQDLRIVDYKTGKSPAPRFQGEALFQMKFYATAMFLLEGKLPLRTQLIYLKDGRTLTYDPAHADVSAMSYELDSLWSAIEERMDSGEFEARRGPLCNWCAFQQYCPIFGGKTPAMSAEGAAQLRTAKEPNNRQDAAL